MARASRSRPETRRIALGEDLRIAQAREAFDAVSAAGAGAKALEIDAAGVARVDAAGLQALAAAILRLGAAGVKCQWGEVSPTLTGAAELCGLSRALALPGVRNPSGQIK